MVVLDRNLNTGELSFNVAYDDAGLLYNATETLVGLTSLNISQDGEHVFVGNPIQSAVMVISRNSQGLLSKKEKIAIPGLEGINDVSITFDGKHVMTTASGVGSKTLTAFDRRQPDPIFAYVESEFDGVNGVDGLLGASAVVVSEDGKHVYVAGLADDSIVAFERDKTKGSTAATRDEHLTYIDSYLNGESGILDISDVDSMALTPNGEFLYVGSADNATLAVFERLADGSLSFVTSYNHTMNTTDGLLGVSGIVVDLTSQHLYVAGRFEASVVHYLIEGDGTLTLSDSVANGDPSVIGLDGARSLVISPDGEHLIVANSIDDSVVVLTRDSMTGNISYLQSVFGVGDQPMDVAISPDGEHIYVASANDHRLSVLKRNANESSSEFGQLTVIQSYIDGVSGFNYLQGARTVAVSSDGAKVYLGAEFDNAISVMDRDQNPNSSSFGQLAIVEVRVDEVDGVDGLNQIYDLVVSKDARHVYAAGFADNAVTAFVLGSGSRCSAQGSGNIFDSVDVGSNGTLTYSVSAKIRSNAIGSLITEARIIAPDNFTVDTPVDNCSTSAVRNDDNCDQDTTNLIPVTDLSITKTDNRLSVIAGEALEYEIAVSNNGPSDAKSSLTESVMVKDILNSNFEPSSVSWTCEATGSGSLNYSQSVSNGNNGIIGLQGVSSVTTSDDLAGLGPHLIATSVLENGLLAFSVNPVTGELTQVLQAGDFVQASSGIQLTGARDVILIDNDIYVVSQVDDSLVAFKAVDNSGLELQHVANHNFSSGAIGLNQAVAVVASEDGKNVYVAGANDNSVAVFQRDLMTGALTYSSVITEGDMNGSQGLSGVNAIAISADGNSFYTSGVNQNAIALYQRNLVDGSLSFVEKLDSNSTAIDMSGISSIGLSSSGNQLYAVSALSDSLFVFTRKTDVATNDSDFGTLSLQQEINQGVDNVVGLLAPSDISNSSDGRHVYVSSEQSDAVLWFARNLDTGNLTFGGLVSDLLANVEGLNGAISVEVSESGDFVYVAGSQDNAIVVLSRMDDSFCPAGGNGNIASNNGTGTDGVKVDVAVNGSLLFKVQATVASNATGTLVNEAGVFSCFEPIVGTIESCLGSDPLLSNNTDDDEDSLNPTADLRISKTDGLSQYDGLNGAIKVTGDADNIYVAANGENAISVFTRDNNNGSADYGNLNYINNVENGVDSVSGLLAVSDVLLSSDGATLYAAGSGDNSLVVFRRNLFDGTLEFLERHSSGIFGVVGIEGIKDLSLSSDGSHIYATGPLTNSLAVFSVDQTIGSNQGRLSFIQNLQNGVAGAAGLASVSDVAVANDGKHVYVISSLGK